MVKHNRSRTRSGHLQPASVWQTHHKYASPYRSHMLYWEWSPNQFQTFTHNDHNRIFQILFYHWSYYHNTLYYISTSYTFIDHPNNSRSYIYNDHPTNPASPTDTDHPANSTPRWSPHQYITYLSNFRPYTEDDHPTNFRLIMLPTLDLMLTTITLHALDLCMMLIT